MDPLYEAQALLKNMGEEKKKAHILAAAQAQATIALVEELRTANLISYLTGKYPDGSSLYSSAVDMSDPYSLREHLRFSSGSAQPGDAGNSREPGIAADARGLEGRLARVTGPRRHSSNYWGVSGLDDSHYVELVSDEVDEAGDVMVKTDGGEVVDIRASSLTLVSEAEMEHEFHLRGLEDLSGPSEEWIAEQ